MNKIKLMFGLLLCFGAVQAQDDITEKANREAEKALQKKERGWLGKGGATTPQKTPVKENNSVVVSPSSKSVGTAASNTPMNSPALVIG